MAERSLAISQNLITSGFIEAAERLARRIKLSNLGVLGSKSSKDNARFEKLFLPELDAAYNLARWIAGIGQTAKKRSRSEIIKWNNEWRYKRISEMPDAIQELMEDYVPQFVPERIRHHIDYFFDIYDAEEKRIVP
jgi:hypothetical protein